MSLHDIFMSRIIIPIANYCTEKKKVRIIYDRVETDPYLIRFYLHPRWLTFGLFRVVLHRFVRSDNPEDGLHDHPWGYMSIILSTGYHEHTKHGVKFHKPGSIIIRRAKHQHRVELPASENGPVYTLFFMGPRIRNWGFQIGDEWHHWKDWIDIRNGRKR